MTYYRIAVRTGKTWRYGKVTTDFALAKRRAREAQNRAMHKTVRLLCLESDSEPLDFDVMVYTKIITGW